MRCTTLVLASALFVLLGCKSDVGDRGFGVSGAVRSAATHEPVLNAWVSLDDTIPEAQWPVDSTGGFSVATWGCGVTTMYAGADGFQIYDTVVDGRGCPVIESVIIELVPIQR